MRDTIEQPGGNTGSGTTDGLRAAPSDRLDPRAKQLWRITGAISGIVSLALAAAVGAALRYFTDFSPLVAALPVIGTLLEAAFLIGVVPDVRWRRWRYEISETEVDMQRGIVSVTRTLVPLTRVQHVDTQQGPLERWIGLSTVVFYTAAGANRIPALATPIADRVRDRIAELARVQDEL